MALSVYKGSFTCNTVTGTQAVTGVGFQPKALIVWGTTVTAAGYSADDIGFFLGCASSASDQWVNGIFSDNAVGPTNSSRQISTGNLIRIVRINQTTDGLASLSSFDADGFTIDWPSDPPSSAWLVHFLALGGADITSAKAGVVSVAAATGDQAFTGVGFRPEFVLMSSNGQTVAAGGQANGSMHIAMTSSTGRQGALAWRDRDGQATSQDASYQRNDKSAAALASNTDTVATEGTLASFDSDGWTINYTTGSLAASLGYLALRGGRYFVGSDTQRTSTGTDSATGLGFRPSGLFMMSTNLANSSSVSATTAKLSVFGADGTREGGCWMQQADAVATTDTDMRTVTDKALGFSTQASTTDAEADLSSFDADGFTLDWTTADATAREFLFAAFGSSVRMLASAGVGV